MEQAMLCSYDYYKRVDGPDRLAVQFNPESYSISGANEYSVKDEAFNSAYRGFRFAFMGRGPSKLEVELLFDSYVHGETAQRDVRGNFSLLRKFLVVEPTRHEPLVLKFVWGSLSFVGVVTGLTETYTMFSDAGLPVRARIKLTVTGCREEDLSGPANQSPDRTKRRMLRQGQTLWEMAAEEYGSPELWRPIARANGIENPLVPPESVELVVPPLEPGDWLE